MNNIPTYFGVPLGQAIGFSKTAHMDPVLQSLDEDKRTQVLEHSGEFSCKEEVERFVEKLDENQF